MTKVPSKVAHDFWTNIYADLEELIADARLDIAEIGNMSGGMGRIVERGEVYDAASEQLPILSIYPPLVGDAVAVARMTDGREIILGSIAQAVENPPVTVGQDWLARADADGATGADVSSNSSAGTWANALTSAITGLEAGTYRVIAWGGFIATHSVASGAADIRFHAEGDSGIINGTLKSPTVHSTALAPMAIHAADIMVGVVLAAAGTITVTLEYRCNTAGTTTARNAWIGCMAYRTA